MILISTLDVSDLVMVMVMCCFSRGEDNHGSLKKYCNFCYRTIMVSCLFFGVFLF